ncbi:hypothetical protein [Fluviicola taffensis]|uniref:hypothetical protein n=1 Tax=Fluviicola taffensis TaxID=191579 RepID=UPI003137D392
MNFFFGTYTTLDRSDQIAIAIANYEDKSITSYVGNYRNLIMGGQMTEAPYEKPSSPKGVWEAVHQTFYNIPIEKYGIGK